MFAASPISRMSTFLGAVTRTKSASIRACANKGNQPFSTLRRNFHATRPAQGFLSGAAATLGAGAKASFVFAAIPGGPFLLPLALAATLGCAAYKINNVDAEIDAKAEVKYKKLVNDIVNGLAAKKPGLDNQAIDRIVKTVIELKAKSPELDDQAIALIIKAMIA